MRVAYIPPTFQSCPVWLPSNVDTTWPARLGWAV